MWSEPQFCRQDYNHRLVLTLPFAIAARARRGAVAAADHAWMRNFLRVTTDLCTDGQPPPAEFARSG
jgi:hypothetical protein